MANSRSGRAAALAVAMAMALLLNAKCAGHQVAAPPRPAAPATGASRAPLPLMHAVPEGTPRAKKTEKPEKNENAEKTENPGKPEKREKTEKVVASRVTRSIDAFMAGRGGRVSAMVKDLSTGRVFRYHRSERLPAASTAKFDILMALLRKTPWRKLDAATRRDADLMIRYSDNKAADRLWLRIGGPGGLAAANEKFGLRHTTPVGGQCVDMYCWGITETSAEDQVRLVSQLVSADSPLPRADRDTVLRLMRQVIPEQKWGISAAACKGDRVALKNGWLRHVSNDMWAVVSVGLIRGHGHDYAVAVLTEDNPAVGTGIAKVEGIAKRILSAFRGPKGCKPAPRH